MDRYLRSLTMGVVVLLLFAGSCGSKKKKEQKVVSIPIKSATLKELLGTLSLAIKHKNNKVVRALYTTESAQTVRYNIKIGIGTAGTIDEQIMLEMKHTKKAKFKLQILSKRKELYSIKWPSGKKFSLWITKEKKKFKIDIIKSPGGGILILKE